jgi:ankyrin repeat protein
MVPVAKANDAGGRQAEARDEIRARGGVAQQAAGSLTLAAPPVAARPRPELSAGVASDPGAKLRAAAAAGRTDELATLLDQGVPVDAPDAAGDTALMESVRADRPAAAALLRRRGASLDRRNQTGQSARDIASTKADAELDRAIGVEP